MLLVLRLVVADRASPEEAKASGVVAGNGKDPGARAEQAKVIVSL